MTDHADVIREFVTHASEVHSGGYQALAALDALVARLTTQTRAAYRMTEKRDEQMALAEAAESRVAELRKAVEPFLAHPRWLSIGSHENTAEIRVSRAAYERLRALAAEETTP